MKKIKSGLCIIFSAGMILSLSACQTEPKNMDSSNNILNSEEETVITEIYTTFGQPVETVFEITKNELMELAWWDENSDKENGIGTENIYPGFELDCEIKNGEYYRVFRSVEKRIEVLEKLYRVEEKIPTSGGDIIIRNASGTSKEYSVKDGIGNTNNKEGYTRDAKKLFFQDLTDDGREELVISIPCRDMTTKENYAYVFDSESLEQIDFPDEEELINKVIGEVSAVQIKDGEEDGCMDVDITIGDKTYEAHTDLIEEWKAEDMRYEVAGYAYGGFGARDSGAYYRTGIYIYHKDYEWSVNNRCIAIDIPLKYNAELNAFEAVDGEYSVS